MSLISHLLTPSLLQVSSIQRIVWHLFGSYNFVWIMFWLFQFLWWCLAFEWFFRKTKKHFIIWRATLAFFIHLCKWLFAFYLAWRTTFLFFFLSAFVLFVLFLYLGLFRMLFFAFTVHNHLVDSPPIIPTHTNGSKYFVPASREKGKLDRVLQCLVHFVWLSSVLWPVGSWSL